MTSSLRMLLASFSVFVLLGARPAFAIDVVVSIKPLHSLVSAVMEGVGTPELVVDGAASPHTYSLKPSDARALEEAEVVFWIGHELETFLEDPLQALTEHATVVEIVHADGLALLAYREGGPWARHEHGEHDGDHDDEAEHDDHDEHADHDELAGHEHEEADMHLWLDPRNAMAIVAAVARTLAAADPEHAAAYEHNALAVRGRLEALDDELEQALSGLQAVPFIVFHDAYQYLEHRYELTAVGSVTVGPDRQPGAERLNELRETIAASGAVCAFAEPQFRPAIIDSIVEGLDTKVAVLDPLGAELDSGPELYFELMRSNVDALSGCLKGSS